MTSFEFADLLYLSLLVGALLLSYIVANRGKLGQMMRHAVSWGLIIVGTIAVIGLWDDIRSTVSPRQTVFEGTGQIHIPRSYDGHYHLSAEINGVTVRFVVDTGATEVVLSRDDAARVGLDVDTLPFVGRAITANGEVKTAPVTLDDVRVGDIIDRRVRATVNGGELTQSLLGMSYLQRYSEITIRDGTLILNR